MGKSDWISIVAVLVSLIAAYIAYRANLIAKNQNASGQWLVSAVNKQSLISIKNISPVRITQIKVSIAIDESVEGGVNGKLSDAEPDFRVFGPVKSCNPGESIPCQFDNKDLPQSIKNGVPSTAIVTIDAKGKYGIHFVNSFTVDVTYLGWSSDHL